jgi:hypothetical protein
MHGQTSLKLCVRLLILQLALPVVLQCTSTRVWAFPAQPQAQIDSSYGPLPVFELHSGFWINLHHTLYQQARQRKGSSNVSGPSNSVGSVRGKAGNKTGPTLQVVLGSKAGFSGAEQRAWDEAVAYYAGNYADQDLSLSTELILLTNQLGNFEGCDELSGAKEKICDAGLPPKLTRILEAAGSVYRAHHWPEHDRANRAWIARVAPLVREQGLGLAQHLADIYQTQWPLEKIRVDVTVFANSSGAYTTLDPLRVIISSADPRNQGPAALEMLFHEASHEIAQTVQQAIIRECRQRQKPIPRDLWHALLFYTTGEVIRPVMASQGAPMPAGDDAQGAGQNDSEYIPYAVREGLYQRGWNEYFKVLTRFWQPYLDGRAKFDDAIAHMVSAL